METIKVYKLFRVKKREQGLFPLFIGKTKAIPMNKWVEAEIIPTKGFALRPGWHSGLLPDAPWLNTKQGTKAADRVWCECEIPANSYQRRADENGGHLHGMLPRGGFYRFKRPGNQGSEWLISGHIKVNRILTDAEVSEILARA